MNDLYLYLYREYVVDLSLESHVDQIVQDGDILDIRPFPVDEEREETNGFLSFMHKQVLNDISSSQSDGETSSTTGLESCRRGIFAITPLKLETLTLSSRFRLPRVSLSIRLLPYTDTVMTPAVSGPVFEWFLPAPLRFKHIDEAQRVLSLRSISLKILFLVLVLFLAKSLSH